MNHLEPRGSRDPHLRRSESGIARRRARATLPRGPLANAEKFVVALLLLATVISSWIGGGPAAVFQGDQAYLIKRDLWGVNGTFYWLTWFVGSIGFVLLGAGLVWRPRSTLGSAPGSLPARPPMWWIGLPWGAFLLLQIAGLLNASYRIAETGEVNLYPEVLRALDHLPNFPTSVDQYRSTTYLFLTGGLMALAAGTFIVFRTERAIEVLMIGLFLHGCILGLVGYLAYFKESERLLFLFDEVNSSFFASFQYKNHWVAFAFLASGCGGAWLHLTMRRSDFRNSPALLIGCGIFALLASFPLKESRAGTLLLAAALGVIVLYGILAVTRKHIASAWWVRLFTPVLVVAVAGLLIGFLIYNPYARVLPSMTIKSRQALERHLQGDTDGRVTSQRYCIRMLGAKPLFGWGLGSFKRMLPVYAESYPGEIGDVAPQRWKTWVIPWEFAHNDWLQLLAEAGVVGAILFLSVPAALVFVVIRYGAWNPLTMWGWISCAFVLGLAWVDYPFWHPTVAMQFAIVFAAAGKYALLLRSGKRGVRCAR